MKIKGQISILIGREITRIELRDSDAAITFAVIELTPEQLASVLSRIAHTECQDFEVNNLDKVGKKMSIDKLIFEIPEETYYYQSDRKKDIIYDLALRNCPEGWEPDNYFGSYDSLFRKDGKHFAQCTIRKWE